MLYRNKRVEIQGTFDADGALTVSVSVPLGPSWELRQIGIKVLGSTSETFCNTYVGSNASGVFISQSYTGNADTDSEPNTTLRPGDSLSAVWTEGTVGALGTLTVVYDEVGY